MSPAGAPSVPQVRRPRGFGWVGLGVGLAIVAGWAVLRHRQPTLITDTAVVARTNLAFRDGRWFQLAGTNAFTGWMVEYYPNGSLCSRTAVSNGMLNGVAEGWYTNRQLQVREHFKDGVSDGMREKWHQNGAKSSEATIVQGKITGTFRSWHDNGQLAEQIDMNLGQPDGIAWAYYPSGWLKAQTTVRHGQVLDRKVWSDGEAKDATALSARRPHL